MCSLFAKKYWPVLFGIRVRSVSSKPRYGVKDNTELRTRPSSTPPTLPLPPTPIFTSSIRDIGTCVSVCVSCVWQHGWYCPKKKAKHPLSFVPYFERLATSVGRTDDTGKGFLGLGVFLEPDQTLPSAATHRFAALQKPQTSARNKRSVVIPLVCLTSGL